jgi:hypothetical protein
VEKQVKANYSIIFIKGRLPVSLFEHEADQTKEANFDNQHIQTGYQNFDNLYIQKLQDE